VTHPLKVEDLGSSLDEDSWDDLLNYIEEKRVIPIVGPELLRVETETGPRAFHDWLAEKLAARLNVDISQLPQPLSLNDVVCWHVASRGRREEPYTRLRSILREASFAPPPALRRLAEITDFDLFVTTTFDGYLEQAINEARFAGTPSTEVISYAPNRVADLVVDRQRMTRPLVYHLLGRVSASPTSAAFASDDAARRRTYLIEAAQRFDSMPESLRRFKSFAARRADIARALAN